MTRRRTPARLLVLVPTAREADLLLGRGKNALSRRVASVLTGIGLAAAGASAGRVFASTRIDAALLVGIAGTFDPERLPLGAAMVATSVACDGIGADEGRRFVALGAWRAQRLAAPRLSGAARGELLSVAAAAGSPSMARERRRRHPRSLAEEMEGFAVALAARAAGVPLTILRGVCNVAGDRVHRRWEVGGALAACRRGLEEWIEVVAR